jgi:hypothetical protein
MANAVDKPTPAPDDCAMMNFSNEKLGISSKFAVAGARNPGPHGHDYDVWARVDGSDFLFAWFPERGDEWWSDVAYAVKTGKRVILCDAAMDTLGASLTVHRAVNTVIYHCGTREEAVALACAYSSHDPKGETRGTRNGYELTAALELCESPIEARLAVHLLPMVIDDTTCRLRAQVNALTYRLDFCLSNEDWVEFNSKTAPNDPSNQPIKLAIECDGHDFHERTKEQAARDKSRDRALMADGWLVARFAGSEIWRTPQKCVQDIYKILDSMGAGIS